MKHEQTGLDVLGVRASKGRALPQQPGGCLAIKFTGAACEH